MLEHVACHKYNEKEYKLAAYLRTSWENELFSQFYLLLLIYK